MYKAGNEIGKSKVIPKQNRRTNRGIVQGVWTKSGLQQIANLRVVNVQADGSYTGENFATSVKELIGAGVQITKRNELHPFAVIPKRWVVERSFAWLEKCRRLWKNCERKINRSLQFVVLAFIAILLKRV